MGYYIPMNSNTLQWSARALGVFWVLFISLFALDVFGQGGTLGQLLLGLFIHLLPALLLLGLLAMAWISPRWGSAAYFLFGIASIFFFHSYTSAVTFSIISAPAFLLAALFYFSSTLPQKER